MKWQKAPNRGCGNTASELYRYTVIRLKDQMERFTDRKPRKDLNRIDYMIWDNEENCEVKN